MRGPRAARQGVQQQTARLPSARRGHRPGAGEHGGRVHGVHERSVVRFELPRVVRVPRLSAEWSVQQRSVVGVSVSFATAASAAQGAQATVLGKREARQGQEVVAALVVREGRAGFDVQAKALGRVVHAQRGSREVVHEERGWDGVLERPVGQVGIAEALLLEKRGGRRVPTQRFQCAILVAKSARDEWETR